MRILVLHAHPLEESLSAALRDRAVRALGERGHEIQVARIGGGDDPGPAPEDLAGVAALVLVYPTWWGSQPAPLLGWIQRALGPWIDGAAPGPSPLRTVQQLIAITTHGSSRLVNVVQGEAGRQLLKRSVLPLCAKRARLRWTALYMVDRLDRSAIDAFVDRVGRELGRLAGPTDPGLTTARASG